MRPHQKLPVDQGLVFVALMRDLCRDGLVGIVGLAVGEEVVDDHADDGEQEDDESPEDFVRYGALRLEDLNCGHRVSLVLMFITKEGTIDHVCERGSTYSTQ
jgi:hypothetical protein